MIFFLSFLILCKLHYNLLRAENISLNFFLLGSGKLLKVSPHLPRFSVYICLRMCVRIRLNRISINYVLLLFGVTGFSFFFSVFVFTSSKASPDLWVLLAEQCVLNVQVSFFFLVFYGHLHKV